MLVLVVEDDPALRQMIAAFLQAEGYQVAEAAEGSVALGAIEQQRPDLILLDLFMPGMDGRAFAGALRARAVAIPIIVLSGAEHAAQWAQEIGAVDHVMKPISLSLLRTRILAVFWDRAEAESQ